MLLVLQKSGLGKCLHITNFKTQIEDNVGNSIWELNNLSPCLPTKCHIIFIFINWSSCGTHIRLCQAKRKGKEWHICSITWHLSEWLVDCNIQCQSPTEWDLFNSAQTLIFWFKHVTRLLQYIYYFSFFTK